MADDLRAAEAEIERLEDEVSKLEKEAAGDGDTKSDNRGIRNGERNNSRNTGAVRLVSDDKAQIGDNYVATFYTARCAGCSGITYSGLDVRNTIYSPEGYRVIAVDPDVIPLGSIVRVTLVDGSSFKAVASDIGSDIKGRRIDVLVASKEEAYRLGRQDVKVEIITEGKR